MAAPSHFFDPFFYVSNPSQKVPDSVSDDGSVFGDDDVPNSLLDGKLPSRSVSPALKSELPITGQGTIAVRGKPQNLLRIVVTTKDSRDPKLVLMVGSKEVLLYYQSPEGQKVDIKTELRPDVKTEDCYLNGGDYDTTYWLSLDKNNGILRYGEHFTNLNCCLFEAVLKESNPEQSRLVWRDQKYSWLEKVRYFDVTLDDGLFEPVIAARPLPVVINLSPFIASNDGISLIDLETGAVTVPRNLPEACQRLYDNVAGTRIVLNGEKFDFEAAIQRSIIDPNGWCHKKLKEKAKKNKFGKPDMTYLRITLGVNQGNSPGIPYVLEIWPSGHYSPIHDHGKSCAIIKVLCGEINATYYDSLNKPYRSIGEAKLTKGQITWLDQDNYQIHKLHNTSDSVCCTIQCYSYKDDDTTHYENFDFIGPNESVEPFKPDSDMQFSQFYRQMKAETESLCIPG